MYSKTQSTMLLGIEANLIDVEIQVSKGIPAFLIIGLASKAIVEAKERVGSAMASCGFPIPPKRVLVNLSPADLKKDGPQFDFAIAAGLMYSLAYIDVSPEFIANACFIAELSITGQLKAVKGILAMTISAIEKGIKYIFTSRDALTELSILGQDQDFLGKTKIFLFEDLKSFKEAFCENSIERYSLERMLRISPQNVTGCAVAGDVTKSRKGVSLGVDFNDIVGQSFAKRAIEIALAGKHHLLLVGPPGCGKSMLAKSVTSLVEDLSFKQKLETRMISDLLPGLANTHDTGLSIPFRAPHSSSSAVSIVGGGVPILPGEVSLAHNGILFLDELAEFDRFTIDQLRTILDNAKVFLNRGNQKIVFPADFLLIAASNPCPCGYLGDLKKVCTCNPSQVQRYQAKISGPILDRIDICVTLSRLSEADMKCLSSSKQDCVRVVDVRARIQKAKEFAVKYSENLELDSESQSLLNAAVMRFDLSSRSHQKIIRLARTIANLEESEHIREGHLAEALQYRVHS